MQLMIDIPGHVTVKIDTVFKWFTWIAVDLLYMTSSSCPTAITTASTLGKAAPFSSAVSSFWNSHHICRTWEIGKSLSLHEVQLLTYPPKNATKFLPSRCRKSFLFVEKRRLYRGRFLTPPCFLVRKYLHWQSVFEPRTVKMAGIKSY